jgi:phosphatidylglycerophosphate synthase
MIESNANNAVRPWGAGKPALVFCALALLMLVVMVPLSELLFDSFAVPALVFALICGLSLRGLLSGYPHEVLGACNIVTLARAALVSVLAGAIFAPVSAWVVCAIAIIAFALDGVDGWFARRSGLASAFGARFDMEIDALLGAVLTLVLLVTGPLGAEVLVLGFSRYAFVLAGLLWPGLQGVLPYSFRRKAICVVQIAALIILVFPLTPAAVLLPVALIGGAALLYSFAVDIIYLMRHST